jgi:hypothetical protein
MSEISSSLALTVKLIRYQPVTIGALRAFIDLRVANLDLLIRDARLIEDGRGPRIVLPHHPTHTAGHEVLVPSIEFTTPTSRRAFEVAVLAAVAEYKRNRAKAR